MFFEHLESVKNSDGTTSPEGAHNAALFEIKNGWQCTPQQHNESNDVYQARLAEYNYLSDNK